VSDGTPKLPGLRTSVTTSALNSRVNDRRGRAFLFAMVSRVGILPGAVPLMVDVRQTGSEPQVHCCTQGPFV